jgi:Uma2 family endonuclease
MTTPVLERTTKQREWTPPLSRRTASPKPIGYPESDGEPMAQNTLQFLWIVLIYSNLEAIFADESLVFLAGDLFWYPIEGDNRTRLAPDVMVVFGRPKSHRGSYLQWLEDNVAPQVVFEILSPGNRLSEMTQKFQFYDEFGVEEYYIYDPDTNELSGWLRHRGRLRAIEPMNGWVSPRLGVRFVIGADELELYTPQGERFASSLELRRRAEAANARVAEERQRAEAERQRAEELAAQLRELGVEPRLKRKEG